MSHDRAAAKQKELATRKALGPRLPRSPLVNVHAPPPPGKQRARGTRYVGIDHSAEQDNQ